MSAYKDAVRHVARALQDAGVTVPVCEGVAVDGAAYPLVLVQGYGDAVDTLGTGYFRAATVVELLVRVVGRLGDETVESIAAVVDAALHGSASVPVAGCARVSEASQVSLEDGTTWLYLGGVYALTVA